MRRYSAILLAILALLICSSGTSYAQSSDAAVLGTVVDASGAAVPNANVDATNVATGVKSSTKANANGEYRFNNLLIGRYDFTATSGGFTTTTIKGLSLQLSQTATVNITMQISSVNTTVEVQDSATVIDTTTAQVQNTFETKQVQDLPTASVGLGVLNLSLLNAGVASSGGVGAGTGPSVAGQRPRNNNFTVEGVDNNSKSVTGPLIFVPNDAVAQFSVLQNQFSPEYGHSSGGQFNTVVKSGTNEFHGVAYDYLQNRNLNAVDQALANSGIRSNPRYDQNRLGGAIGGPIFHNKWFFFGNFEYNPIGQASTPSSAVYTPTAAGYSALGSIPGISQTNLGILKQYATAAPTADPSQAITVGGVNIPVGILPLASPNFQNNYYVVGSSDYTISDKDQLRGRIIWNKNTAIDVNPTLPQFFLGNPTTYWIGTLTEFHNFSPNLINELRLGYNRYNSTTSTGDFKFPGLDSFPNLQFSDLNLQVGPDPNGPQFTIQNLYQLTDNVTWIKGNHTFKFGNEFRKYISPQFFTQRARGDYEYTAIENYLFDYTPDDLSQRSLGSPTYYGDQIADYIYVNDNWRFRPNLTFNLGLRYEYTTVPFGERAQSINSLANVPGLISFHTPTSQKTNFGPRIGVAYSPGTSGQTSIRAGFGINYDVLFDNIGILSLPPQFSTTVDNTNITSSTVSGFLKNGGIANNAPTGGPLSVSAARAGTSALVPDQTLPYSIQWNVGVQRVFAKDWTLEARYVGTRGVHLDVQTRLNKINKVSPSLFIPTYLTAPSAATLAGLTTTLGQIQKLPNTDPTFAAAGFTSPITTYPAAGNSSYHGLALQLNRRFTNGLQMQTAYTWSHATDNSTADFFTTVLTPRRPENFQNLTPEKSNSALDHRHRLSMSLIYDLPFFKSGNNWLMKNVVGNWEIAPVYIFQSGEFYTVQSQVDSNLNGDAFTDRAIVNSAGQAGVGSNVVAYNAAGQQVKIGDVSTVAYVATTPNARYIKAQVGALTNSGRNTLVGRPINNWDVTLLKRFSYGERVKLELQGQFLNAFNHPQYVPGSLNQINSIGYTNGGTRNFLTPGNALFNTPDQTFGSNPRSIQVVAKVVF